MFVREKQFASLPVQNQWDQKSVFTWLTTVGYTIVFIHCRQYKSCLKVSNFKRWQKFTIGQTKRNNKCQTTRMNSESGSTWRRTSNADAYTKMRFWPKSNFLLKMHLFSLFSAVLVLNASDFDKCELKPGPFKPFRLFFAAHYIWQRSRKDSSVHC